MGLENKLANLGVTKSKLFSSQAIIVMLALLTAVFFGIFSVLYSSIAGEKIGILLALPGAIIIGLVFIIDRYILFFLIVLLRASIDPVLDATRLGAFSLGAVLNALVIAIAVIAIAKRPSPVKKILCQTWVPFLVVTSLTIMIAPDKLTAIKSFLVLLSYASMFALPIVLIKNEQDYGRWIRAIFCSSIIPVVYAFIDIAKGGYIGHESEGFRISSTFAHPNSFAFYLVLMISLGFYFFKSKVNYFTKTVLRVLPIYILIMLALLVLTKTRSAWAACFVFFTIYALLYERKYLILIILVPIAGLMIPEVRDRFADLAQGNEVVNYSQLNSYAWRKLIWSSSLSWMEPTHYFFGYGLDAFRFHSIDFFPLSGGREHEAHSVYVQLLFETGFVGLATFVWIHFKVARLLWPFYKSNKLMIFSGVMFLLEFALDAYSDNMLAYLSFNWYLWFVLGAAYAVNYSKQSQCVKP